MMKKRFSKNTLIGFYVAVLLISVIAVSGCATPTEKSQPTEELQPKIAIVDYKVSTYDVGVDKVYLDNVVLLLKNEGDASANITKLVISSNGESIEDHTFATLEPGEEKEVSYDFGLGGKLGKDIGIEQIIVTMKLFGYPERKGIEEVKEQTLADKIVAIPIPRARIGDTIPEVSGKHSLSLTLLWWKESNIAVDGPYSTGYYTFTAKPGMKFVILAYRFQNNWIREQATPYLNAGEIGTDEGYIYSVWSPPIGVHSEEYEPRKATSEELENLIGDSGGYEDLLPEESIKGCVVFEIPEGATPIEASIVYVPSLIKFGGD